jgi:hypothetical protein
MTIGKATATAVVGFTLAVLTDLSVGTLLGVIVSIELAQFALIIEHRGRLSTVETLVEASEETEP